MTFVLASFRLAKSYARNVSRVYIDCVSYILLYFTVTIQLRTQAMTSLSGIKFVKANRLSHGPNLQAYRRDPHWSRKARPLGE